MEIYNGSVKSVFAGAIIIAAVLLPFRHAFAGAIIVDHRCTDITKVPESAINQAKANLHVAYGHTFHGSRLTAGMTGLVAFVNSGGKRLSLPQDIFAWNNGGTGETGNLHLRNQQIRDIALPTKRCCTISTISSVTTRTAPISEINWLTTPVTTTATATVHGTLTGPTQI